MHSGILLQTLATLLMVLGWTLLALSQKRPLARLTGHAEGLSASLALVVRVAGTAMIAVSSLIWVELEGLGFGSLMALLVATFAVFSIALAVTARWWPFRQLARLLISCSAAASAYKPTRCKDHVSP